VVEDFSAGLNLVCGESNAGKCLTGDTVITDRDGSMRTILDMFRQGSWVVPSVRSGKFSFERASGVAANGDKPVFVLETRRGRRIKATENHRFFTPEGWRQLGEMRVGDWVAVARRIPVFGSVKLPAGHARLMGYLLGDGGVIEAVSFTNEEQDVLEDFKGLVLSLGDHHFEVRPAGNATVVFPSKPLDVKNRNMGKSGVATFCDQYGLTGHKHNSKRVPDVVFTCCEEDVRELIRGLIITDGWVSRRAKSNSFEAGFCTTSEILARQLSHLLTRFGVVSTLRRKKTTWEYLGEKKKGWAYSVDVHGRRFVCRLGEVLGYDFVGKKSGKLRKAVDAHDMDRVICRYDGVPRTKAMVEMVRRAVKASKKTHPQLRKEMGLHERTSLEGSAANETFGMTFLERLADVTGSRELRGVVESDLLWDRVRKVESAGVEPTFDIEVPGTHAFFANDIYTHNTSIVRALKLAAYNEFDPRSIRVGATKCKVLVETERGTVLVKRGPKDNLWEVTRNGQPTQYFDKVGKNVVPQAAEVLGLNVVTLGDAQVPVNIMDQLESHFMLKGVGDKDASGSMRAQIVDEISGLSGIEGLIRSVSLDNHRLGRDVKETEDRMEEVRKGLHDEKLLEAEGETLGRAGKSLDDADEAEVAAEGMEVMETEFLLVSGEVEGREQDLAAMPDEAAAKALADEAAKDLEAAEVMGRLYDEEEEAGRRIGELEGELSAMPDSEAALGRASEAQDALGRAEAAEGMSRDLDSARKDVEGLEGQLGGLGDPARAKELADEADEAMGRLGLVGEMGRELREAQESVSRLEGVLAETEELEEVALRERDEAVAAVKVCPLTLGPVSEECMRQAKEARG
jgi:intein/homing endonuclease